MVTSSTSASNKSVVISSPSLSKDKGSKSGKPSSEKKKVAAIDAPPSRVRRCFLCQDPAHFCYQCPDRKLEGCCLCGEDHFWQDCPSLEGKFVKKQNAAYVSVDLTSEINELKLENHELKHENNELKLDDSECNHAAELAVPEICWQTHEPLYLSAIEWKEENAPIRLPCVHKPSFSRRLVYRCKVQDKNARCLFDSGATCCLMSLSWAEKNNIPCRSVNGIVKTAVQDKKQSKLMTLPLKFELGDFCITWEFLYFGKFIS